MAPHIQDCPPGVRAPASAEDGDFQQAKCHRADQRVTSPGHHGAAPYAGDHGCGPGIPGADALGCCEPAFAVCRSQRDCPEPDCSKLLSSSSVSASRRRIAARFRSAWPYAMALSGPPDKSAAPGAFMVARAGLPGIAASHHRRLQLTGRQGLLLAAMVRYAEGAWTSACARTAGSSAAALRCPGVIPRRSSNAGTSAEDPLHRRGCRRGWTRRPYPCPGRAATARPTAASARWDHREGRRCPGRCPPRGWRQRRSN